MPAATTSAPPSAFSMEELMWHYEQLQGQPPATLYAHDPVILEELRCGYSSKRCDNVRTTKKGGGLHRFCEFHRRRANKNQWRVDNKRRLQRSQQGDAAAPASPPSVASTAAKKPYSPRAAPRVVQKEKREQEAALPEPVERLSVDAAVHDDEDDAWLSDSDLAMLQSILFDDSERKPGFLSLLADKEPVVGSPTAVYDLHQVKTEWVV